MKEKTKHLIADQIAAWCYDTRLRAPYSIEEKAYFESYRQKFSPDARHIGTWFETLDAEEKRL